LSYHTTAEKLWSITGGGNDIAVELRRQLVKEYNETIIKEFEANTGKRLPDIN